MRSVSPRLGPIPVVIPVPPPPEPQQYVSDDETSEESSTHSSELAFTKREYIDLRIENRELLMKLKAMKFLLDMEKKAKKIIIEKFKIIENHYDNEKCAICHEVEGEKVVIGCKHMFHDRCIKRWTKKTCPMCRQDMELELFKFKSKVSKYEHKII